MSDCATFAALIAAIIILTFFCMGALRGDKAQMWDAGVLAVVSCVVIAIDILT